MLGFSMFCIKASAFKIGRAKKEDKLAMPFEGELTLTLQQKREICITVEWREALYLLKGRAH